MLGLIGLITSTKFSKQWKSPCKIGIYVGPHFFNSRIATALQRPSHKVIRSSSCKVLALGEKWRHFNIKFWGKQLAENTQQVRWWRAHWHTEAYKSFNPGFKCCATHLAWGWQAIIVKQDLGVSVLPAIYIYSLFVYLTCTCHQHLERW